RGRRARRRSQPVGHRRFGQPPLFRLLPSRAARRGRSSSCFTASPDRFSSQRRCVAGSSRELGPFHLHGWVRSSFILERRNVLSIALSIAFTGLCALIGDGDGKPGQILLLDAKGVGQVRGVALPAHAPTLVVSLNDLANPDSSSPTRVVAGTPNQTGRVDQLGLWDLTGSEVRIRAQGGEGSGL